MCYCSSLNLSHSLLPPEKAMTPHSSTLAWKIPWTEEPLSCTGEGNGNPLQCSCLENPKDGGAWWAAVHGVAKSRTQLSDFTFTFHFHALEKDIGNPLQCSCLENPRDGGGWWAAVYVVTQSRTRLKRLSSSSYCIPVSIAKIPDSDNTEC